MIPANYTGYGTQDFSEMGWIHGTNYNNDNKILNIENVITKGEEIEGDTINTTTSSVDKSDYSVYRTMNIVTKTKTKYIEMLSSENRLNKLITTNSLKDAYVNELKLENNDWMNENEYKLLTVKALKDLKITGEGVNVDEMILYNKYKCEIIEGEQADEIGNDGLYSLEFVEKVMPNTGLTIYFNDLLVNNYPDITSFTEVKYEFVRSNVTYSYRVIDKYYGFIFDIYSLENEFKINIINNGETIASDMGAHMTQNIAILRNGTQANERMLDKAAILKYCEVEMNDPNIMNKMKFIIKYSNNEPDEVRFKEDSENQNQWVLDDSYVADDYAAKTNTFIVKGMDFIIGDELLINSGDKFVINGMMYANLIYDGND